MRLSLSKFNCQIVFASPDLSALADFCGKSSYTSCAFVADASLYPLLGEGVQAVLEAQGLPVYPILLPPGEAAKTLETADHSWKKMAACGLDRKSLVVTLGGGSISDIGGFVASCYMRGIDCIHIPTSLLAMVDASIGGKTGLNLPSGRTVVGTFHHPRLVLIVPAYLSHLPEREFSSGMAEVIKASVIADPELFDYLQRFMVELRAKDSEKLKNVIAKACKIKVEVIRADEKEKTGRRSHLNYGHTFGHAIEMATDYRRYTHGEAVAIGMSYAARISRLMGLVDDTFLQRQDQLCHLAGLPTQLDPEIASELLIELMLKDKKAIGGKLALVLPRQIGKVDLHLNIDTQLVKQVLTYRENRGFGNAVNVEFTAKET
jgi:3-dehydroquinate synthase